MSKDFTAQVIYQPETHLLEGIKQAQRYVVGDILTVWPVAEHSTFDDDSKNWFLNDTTNPKFLFIHVTDVPDNVDYAELVIEEMVPNGSPIMDSAKETPFILRRNRKFKIDLSLISVQDSAKLLADKQITITFQAFKAITQKKIVNDKLDSTHDSHNLITDGDI